MSLSHVLGSELSARVKTITRKDNVVEALASLCSMGLYSLLYEVMLKLNDNSHIPVVPYMPGVVPRECISTMRGSVVYISIFYEDDGNEDVVCLAFEQSPLLPTIHGVAMRPCTANELRDIVSGKMSPVEPDKIRFRPSVKPPKKARRVVFHVPDRIPRDLVELPSEHEEEEESENY